MLKFIYTHISDYSSDGPDVKATFTMDDDETIDDAVDAFFRFMAMVGYHTETIASAMSSKAQEHLPDEDDKVYEVELSDFGSTEEAV
jgi:hypothetical protein